MGVSWYSRELPPFPIERIRDIANNADLATNLTTLFSGNADCTNRDIMTILLVDS